MPQNKNFWENPIFKSFWCSYNALLLNKIKRIFLGLILRYWCHRQTYIYTYVPPYIHAHTPTYITYILANSTGRQNVFQLNNCENAYLVLEEELKNLFVLWKSLVSFLRLFILLYSTSNHSINFEHCDALMHIDTQLRAYFYVHLGQLINIVISIIFWKNFS